MRQNDFENELRLALAYAEEHGLKEYVLTAAVGTRKNKIIYCLCIELLKNREQLEFTLSDKGAMEPINKFRGLHRQLPACVIKVHVVGVPKNVVVARILQEITSVIELPTPKSVAKVQVRNCTLGLESGQSTQLPSKSETERSKAPYQPTVDEIKKLFSDYDRGNDPPVEVSDLIAEIEERLSLGKDIPYTAFVTGPRINYRVEFNDYNGGWHRRLVSESLMEMIRRGAERIVIISEVWVRNDDGVAQWHGVTVLEATASGDICHMAEFEGDRRVGEWHSGIPGDTGNLARLFERAVAGNQNGVDIKSTHDPHKPETNLDQNLSSDETPHKFGRL